MSFEFLDLQNLCGFLRLYLDNVGRIELLCLEDSQRKAHLSIYIASQGGDEYPTFLSRRISLFDFLQEHGHILFELSMQSLPAPLS